MFWNSPVLAQVQPLPIEMEGYQQFWINQTPAQRVQSVRREFEPEDRSPALDEDSIDPTAPPSNTLALGSLDLLESTESFGSQGSSPTPGGSIPSPSTASPNSTDPNSIHAAPIAPLDLAPTEDDLNQQRLQRLLAEGAAAVAAREAAASADPQALDTEPLDPQALEPQVIAGSLPESQSDPAQPGSLTGSEASAASLPQPETVATDAAALLMDPTPRPWVHSDAVLDQLGSALIEPQNQAPELLIAQAPIPTPFTASNYAPQLLQKFPIFDPQSIPSLPLLQSGSESDPAATESLDPLTTSGSTDSPTDLRTDSSTDSSTDLSTTATSGSLDPLAVPDFDPSATASANAPGRNSSPAGSSRPASEDLIAAGLATAEALSSDDPWSSSPASVSEPEVSEEPEIPDLFDLIEAASDSPDTPDPLEPQSASDPLASSNSADSIHVYADQLQDLLEEASDTGIPPVQLEQAKLLLDQLGSDLSVEQLDQIQLLLEQAALDTLTDEQLDQAQTLLQQWSTQLAQAPAGSSEVTGSAATSGSGSSSNSGYDPGLLAKFPIFQPGGSVSTPGLASGSGPIYAPQLLAKFPIFQPGSQSTVATNPEDEGDPTEPDLPPSKGSEIRQQLEANLQTEIPLDPDQMNVSGDVLSYLADQDIGIAEGNARIQFADGSTVTGDKLLFYRRERRLRSDGPFIMTQSTGGSRGRNSRGSTRQIQGVNLDLDIPTRSAQFESSLVILPGEAEGTKIFIRSEETTALLGDQIFFENATITTSTEPPVTHYVKGDRVEVFPDDRIYVYDARVFGGGEQDDQGDISAGVQLAYFPLFVYSLRDHQWVLPGQSEEEGLFVKSSWAYHFDQYNFGGLRVDLIQNKGLGIGVVHDYILPIPDTVNYGRAQFYTVTEADEGRTSSRFRVDHFFDFYMARIWNQEGTFKGNFNLNLDNTYRPEGGRNDNADFRLSSTFRTDLSTTTMNVSRTGSPERGTYNLPVTMNHQQRYDGVRWLTSDVRLDYNQRLSTRGGRDESNARLTLGSTLKPPGWGGNYQLTYRTYSSSTGDRESRRNFELAYNPTNIRITPNINFSTNLTITQNQQPDRETDGLNFFNKYESRSSLRFQEIDLTEWATFIPGSIDYFQALYSTPDQESTVTLNPRMSLKPAEWNEVDLRLRRVFNGNNSVPFQTISSSPRDTHQIDVNVNFFTPRNLLPDVPPGYVAFEDDLPGELPIALTFPDDTVEDIAELEAKTEEELQANVRNLFRFDTSTGFDYATDRWDPLNARFSWNTSPTLFNLELSTSYDPNEGELRPINLTYRGNSSTTFDRDLRSGLDEYEPGFSYGLTASYDPETGDLSRYNLDLDATLGTTWQNHWRLRFNLDDEGLRRVEVRRDLRDFEIRLAYDPKSELLRLEGILVAFPSRPVGLTQQRGDFLLSTPAGTLGSDDLLP